MLVRVLTVLLRSRVDPLAFGDIVHELGRLSNDRVDLLLVLLNLGGVLLPLVDLLVALLELIVQDFFLILSQGVGLFPPNLVIGRAVKPLELLVLLKLGLGGGARILVEVGEILVALFNRILHPLGVLHGAVGLRDNGPKAVVTGLFSGQMRLVSIRIVVDGVNRIVDNFAVIIDLGLVVVLLGEALALAGDLLALLRLLLGLDDLKSATALVNLILRCLQCVELLGLLLSQGDGLEVEGTILEGSKCCLELLIGLLDAGVG